MQNHRSLVSAFSKRTHYRRPGIASKSSPIMKLSPSFGIVTATYSASSIPLISAFALAPLAASSRPSSSLWTRLFSSSDTEFTPTFPTWSFDEPCLSMEWSSLLDVDLSVVPSATAADVLEADLVVVGIMAPPAEEKDDDEEQEDADKEDPVAEVTGIALELQEALGGSVLSDVLAENIKTFKNGAKRGSMTPMTRVMADGTSSKVVLVGLGATPKEEEEDAEKPKKDPFEGAGSELGKALAGALTKLKKIESCSIVVPEVFAKDAKFVSDFSAAFYQELYVDNRFKSKAKKKKIAEDLKKVVIYSEGEAVEEGSAAVEAGRNLASGLFLTKDIVNAPCNVMNSLSLAETAKRVAEESNGSIRCQILGKDECEKRGMGAYLGVARGAETEPQFIHLTYKPEGEIKKKVAVVGKGLLFDTGGYNIKTGMMELMKFDCGGAAAVLGAARAIGSLKPEGVEAHFLVAATENMISSKAYKPSDILTASNGKTIEVLNTDAEGRLTLADALVYADKEVGAESIIELSTLTGACMISLGKSIAGVWTANDDLAGELDSVSKKTGDKVWRMPMASEYNELLESKFADLKNIGTRYGGAITAALFLQNFVSKKKPFAHIDIAGPVWSDKSGATGYGAKLVTEWVTRQGQ